MCEVSSHQPAWTKESGLCSADKDYDDPRYPSWNIIHESNLTKNEKCEYLFRCAWSKGFEHDCPCNHENCSQMMMNVCSTPDSLIIYPPKELISSNILVTYNYSHSMENPQFHFFLVVGDLKCRGYFFQTKLGFQFTSNYVIFSIPTINHLLCQTSGSLPGHKNYSSPYKNDMFCWNDSLTFNGRPYAVNPNICTTFGECISQYRIRDGMYECMDRQDEEMYIDKNSTRNSSNNILLIDSQEQEPTNRMPFRRYCNSFWNLEKHIDEIPSSCQYWVCQKHQYQCQTGQCIELDWICDGEWDCSDASDEEAIVLIEKWSIHNARLSNLSSLVEKCRKRYSRTPFSNICNTSHHLNSVVIDLMFQIHWILNRIVHVLTLLKLVMILKIAIMPMMKKIHSY
jgi:hypothetical protein